MEGRELVKQVDAAVEKGEPIPDNVQVAIAGIGAVGKIVLYLIQSRGRLKKRVAALEERVAALEAAKAEQPTA